MRVDAVQARDDSMEEVLARVDVDAADDPLGELAEVGGEMDEQVGPGGDEEQAAQGTFDRDHAKDQSCARRVAGPHSAEPKHLSKSLLHARGSDATGLPTNRQARR